MPSEGVKRIAAKRANTTVGAIKRKQAAGTANGNERASIRIGKTNTRIMTGVEDLSEWDEEELRRGQRRNKNGRFVGRAPRVVPKAVHDELVRRTLSKAHELFRDNLVQAVQVLTELVTDPSVEAKDKLRAIQMITDRAMGKNPERVEISAEQPWLVALEGAIVSVDAVNDPADEDDDPEDQDQ